MATKIRYFPFSAEDDEYVPAAGPFFSCDAQALREEAARRERDGATEAANELRRQAKYFEDLRQNADEKNILRWEFESDDCEKFQAMAWLGKEDDEIFEALCARTMKYCQYLSEQATAGRATAAHRLALVAILATRVLGEIAKRNPEALRDVSERHIAWPIMKSKNQKFSNDHKKLLRILRVGMKCGGSIGQTSDFVPRNRFGKISARLWKYVNDTRERMRYFQKHNPKYIREIEQKCPDALALEHEAAMLPDPGADMAETKWWEMGKQFLIESYPHPKLPGQLNENVPVLDNLITARSHRRGRAAKLNRIEFEFERNFERFAKQCRKGTVITNTSG